MSMPKETHTRSAGVRALSETCEEKPGRAPTVGLALGGGGAAGLAHIGILEELAAAGVSVGCVAGTSAGALVGAAFASGKLSELRETLEGLSWSRVISLFDPTWPRAGLVEGRRGLHLVQPCLGPRIEDLELPFAAIATDLHTGDEVVLDHGSTLDAVRASAALPGIFTPRLIEGRTLIDGGLVNPVPVSAVRRLGADFVIAVSVHPIALDGPRQPEVVANGRLPEKPRDMGILEIVRQSSILVQMRIAASRFREDPPEALIVPPTVDVGLFELHRTVEVVGAGRRAGRDALRPILEALGRRSRLGAPGGEPGRRSSVRA